LGIDFTARDVQAKCKEKGLPWEKAKAFDGAAVIGKFVSKSSFEALDNISFSLKKNEQVVQKGNSSHMLWQFDELIEYVSKYFTLKIGDVIFTGTPSGVAKVNPDDVLAGFIADEEFFKIRIK